MSNAAAAVAEIPAKAGESAIEKPKGEVRSKVESGDISGVYRIAQSEVDDELARGLGLSKFDDAGTAAVAGPEIVALKQADAEFENKAKTALGGLKGTLDAVNKPEAPIVEAKHESPAVVLPVIEEQKPVETKSMPVEVPVVTEIPVVETVVAPVVEVKLEAPVAEEVEVKQEVTQDAMLQKLDAELIAEKKALEEFQGTHGKAHTPLEQAYLDALTGRITSLEFEKKAHTNGDTGFEALAKAAELKQKADKAEAAYQSMYDGFMNQPVEAHPEQVAVPETSKEDEEDEDDHVSAFGSGTYQPTSGGGSSERQQAARPSFESSPMSMGTPQKPKGRMGKFVDSLKFWKYFTGKQ
ncbi:hypothetical protein K8R04_02365 [Candidatus Uhrbacteria bacterium]|nr:hypothetical protein [Candidatus Uhrbacteria bacterium]